LALTLFKDKRRLQKLLGRTKKYFLLFLWFAYWLIPNVATPSNPATPDINQTTDSAGELALKPPIIKPIKTIGNKIMRNHMY